MNIKEQKQDRFLFFTIIAMISFGLFMLFSASWVKSLEITGGDSRTYFLTSQMIKLIPAFFIFIFLTKINYRKLQFFSPYLLFLSFLLVDLRIIGIPNHTILLLELSSIISNL